MKFSVVFLMQADSSDSSSYMRTRKREKRSRRNQLSARNEETGRNRLLARALYDTENEVKSCVTLNNEAKTALRQLPFG